MEVSGTLTAATWPWYVLMGEVLGQRLSTSHTVLIASIPKNTSGPSVAVGDEEEEEESQPAPPGKRMTDREDDLIELLREDIRLQRETDRERMDRLINLLEGLSKK